MTIYFFLRATDHRVRIIIKIPHRTRPNDYFCLPLNMLEIIQQGSCLQLCRRRHAGTELILWATIKFTTIESIESTLFRPESYLTHSSSHGYILLHILGSPLPRRRQTSWKYPRLWNGRWRRAFWRVSLIYSLLDHPQLTNSSPIIDGPYKHALRIYQDTLSGAIRLQASVHLGDMDR